MEWNFNTGLKMCAHQKFRTKRKWNYPTSLKHASVSPKNIKLKKNTVTVWQERDLPCSGSAVAAGWAHLLRWASAWPAPRPSCRSTSTAPQGCSEDVTSARRSPPGALCQHAPPALVFTRISNGSVLSVSSLIKHILLVFWLVFYIHYTETSIVILIILINKPLKNYFHVSL